MNYQRQSQCSGLPGTFTKEAFYENEKDKPQTGRKDLQNMYLVKNLHPEYIYIFLKNNGQFNKITILKNGQQIWTIT